MIQFSQLWGLLALISVPLILLLFVLRPKRITLTVSTNKLWRDALNDRRRGFGLQKLFRDLSLLLLVLIALLLSLGLGGLGWSTHPTERDDVVVVLDVSASMKARGVGRMSRFHEAKEEAAKIIGGLDESSSLLLMTSGRNAILRTTFESDRSLLAAELDQIEATDEAGSPRQALILALSLLQQREQGKIYFITDGAFDGIDDLHLPGIEYRLVEGFSQNVAITRFDIRPEVGSDDRYQALVTVRNYTADVVTTTLTVELDGQPLFRRQLELTPDDSQTLVLPVNGRISGAARAHIDVDDDFEQDNQAFAVVDRDEPLRVLLISPENFYLESAIAALPNVEITRLGALPRNIADLAWFHDVVVLDNIAAPRLPPGNYLLINSVAPGLPITTRGDVVLPEIIGKSEGAIVRNIDLAGLRIDRAKKIIHSRKSASLHRLFWSPETDLALAMIENDVRLVLLGFDLSDSSFPLQASFPLFIAESFSWLRPRSEKYSRTQRAAGEPVAVLVPKGSNSVILQTPSGRWFRYEPEDVKFQFHRTAEAGIYRYNAGSIDRQFAVNLTDERESDIRPRALPPILSETVSATSSNGVVNFLLWPYLVITALLLLVFEWALWCWRGASA